MEQTGGVKNSAQPLDYLTEIVYDGVKESFPKFTKMEIYSFDISDGVNPQKECRTLNKKKIAIITTCCLLVAGIVGGTFFLKTSWTQLPVETVPESSSTSSVAESASSDDDYSVPPIPLIPPEELAANRPPKENTETVTVNPDGTTSTEISRPEWSKPEGTPPTEPAGPPKDETTKKDDTTTGSEPDGKTPEASTPETEKPADPKPDKPKPPTGGETNNNGEIYVPGFGWQKPTGGFSEKVEMNPNGNIIGH